MESTLHRQLKTLYGGEDCSQEVNVDGYRVDVCRNGQLVEIQQASLGALRTKTRNLLERHDVVIVKPLAVRKQLVWLAGRGRRTRIESRRLSPLRQTWAHVFDDLVHFVEVFPHSRLTLEVALTEQEEHRRRLGRRWGRNYHVCDRVLVSVIDQRQLCTAEDLWNLLPQNLPRDFSTADLANLAGIPRWLAQKAAYCLRKAAGAVPIGKQGNSILYRRPRVAA